MKHDEIKFDYSLSDSGWANVVIELGEKKYEYKASYTCSTLDQIFDMAVNVLEHPANDEFNSCIFVIDEEWRSIEIHFLFEIGQNRMANIKIIENKNNKENIIHIGKIDYYQFIEQALMSATKILKKCGLVGYSYNWESSFPLTEYLRTLDFFEDYHYFDIGYILTSQADDNLYKTDIHDEIKLLNKYLGTDYPKKDIYYYIYKGNLSELEDYISNNPNEIDKLNNEKYKYTPLICAIKAGMESCALMLIRYGANVNSTDNKQQTTLHFAVQAHSYSVCKKLIEMNKSLVNTPNDWGRTPIFENIPYIKNQTKDGNDYRIFDLLLQNDADLYYKALNKITPRNLIEENEKDYKNNLIEYIKMKYPKIKL